MMSYHRRLMSHHRHLDAKNCKMIQSVDLDSAKDIGQTENKNQLDLFRHLLLVSLFVLFSSKILFLLEPTGTVPGKVFSFRGVKRHLLHLLPFLKNGVKMLTFEKWESSGVRLWA